MPKRQLLNGIVNRIRLIGVELEGGWDIPIKGEKVIRDGSVLFEPPAIRRNPETGQPEYVDPTFRAPQYGIGEIVSKPMTPDQIEAWITKCYPQHVNSTCGLHVHMSFHNKLNYSRLITPEFTPFMVSELTAWGRRENIPTTGQGEMFWARLNPDHPWTQRHCLHAFLGDKQILMKKKDYNSRGKDYSRYTFINYCDALVPANGTKPLNTVECRGLPMFDDAATSCRAIMAVLDATNRFLSKIRTRESQVVVSVPERPVVNQTFGAVIR